MSNGLIGRSAVIAIIEKKRLTVGKHDLSAEYKLAGVQEEIENLPTAYDVDKAVEQLEKLPHGKYSDDYGKGFSAGINAAIGIVKSGGME